MTTRRLALSTLLCTAGVMAFTLTAAPAGAASGPPAGAPFSPAQTIEPFSGLDNPGGVALDKHGDVFVADSGNHRVLELRAHASTPVVLPFSGLGFPDGVAVDKHGDVFVADDTLGEVLELPAGSSTQEVAPFTGLDHPTGVAVDKAGDIFVSNTTECENCGQTGDDEVFELSAHTNVQTSLPLTGLYYPRGIAVDKHGDILVVDGDNDRVLELPAGSSTQVVLPFTGLDDPSYVAVNKADDLYLGESGSVLELPAGSSTQVVLPFTGLSNVRGVALNKSGRDLFVADAGNNRVLELPVRR